MAVLIDEYDQSIKVSHMAEKLQGSLSTLELDAFVAIINTHFARISYPAYQHDKEGSYQALFLFFLELSEIKAQGGVVTNQRRMDVLCELAGMSYIFELKVDQKASIAMRQALGQE